MAQVKIGKDLLYEIFVSSHMGVKREIAKNLPSIVKGGGSTILKEAIERNPMVM